MNKNSVDSAIGVNLTHSNLRFFMGGMEIFRLWPLLAIIPVLEILLIAYLGKNMGLLYTLIIISSTGFLGVILIKHQGLSVIKNFNYLLRSGQVPGNEILNGILVLTGAILLLTPGLITDSLGLFLLIPWSRKLFHYYIKTKLFNWIMNRSIRKY